MLGAVAHLGERLHGMEKVASSSLVSSTISRIQSKYKIFTLFLCRFLTKMVKNSKIHTILKIAKFRLVCIINEKMVYVKILHHHKRKAVTIMLINTCYCFFNPSNSTMWEFNSYPILFLIFDEYGNKFSICSLFIFFNT